MILNSTKRKYMLETSSDIAAITHTTYISICTGIKYINTSHQVLGIMYYDVWLYIYNNIYLYNHEFTNAPLTVLHLYLPVSLI